MHTDSNIGILIGGSFLVLCILLLIVSQRYQKGVIFKLHKNHRALGRLNFPLPIQSGLSDRYVFFDEQNDVHYSYGQAFTKENQPYHTHTQLFVKMKLYEGESDVVYISDYLKRDTILSLQQIALQEAQLKPSSLAQKSYSFIINVSLNDKPYILEGRAYRSGFSLKDNWVKESV